MAEMDTLKAYELCKKSLQWEKLKFRRTGIPLLFISICILIFAQEKMWVHWMIIGAMLLLSMVFLLPSIIAKDAAKHKLMKLIQKNPDKVVWIHSLRTDNMPFGIHLFGYAYLKFCMNDGKIIELDVPSKVLKEYEKSWLSLFPNVIKGHNEEKQGLYEKDPKTFFAKAQGTKV